MENNREFRNIKIGEITISEKYGNMPIAEIVTDSGKAIGYLSPFRGYCFQVSRTFDGDMDMASSQVIGLGNIVELTRPTGSGVLKRSNCSWDETIHQLLKGQATIALFDLTSRGDLIYKQTGFGRNTTSWGEEVWCNDKLDLFIQEVIHYLKNFNK